MKFSEYALLSLKQWIAIMAVIKTESLFHDTDFQYRLYVFGRMQLLLNSDLLT